MENEAIQIIQALLQCIEKYPEGSENKEWLMKLFQDSLNGRTNIETEAGLIYNATVIENILATLLAIDIKLIVKVRMVHKVITTTWEENKWDLGMLNRYILEEKPMLQDRNQNNLENYNFDEISNREETITTIQYNLPTINLEETPSEEIEMSENNQPTTNNQETDMKFQPTTTHMWMEDISHNVLGKNITTTQHYDIRNRKPDPSNPYYITKGRRFRLGALTVNIPGEDKTQQLAFATSFLKLSTNKELIQYEFWEGNSWITIGFDYEEDLNVCKSKINEKGKDLIKFIRLTTEKEKPEIQQTIESKHLAKQIFSTSSKNDTMKMETVNKEKTNLEDPTKPNAINKTITKENPYNITHNTTNLRGGFLSAKIPGNNRKEQIDYITKILRLNPDNDLIYPVFHEGNSWITVHFNNSTELNKCIDDINNQYKDTLNMITMSDNKTEWTRKEAKFKMTKHLNPTKTYKIMDIPEEVSNIRIKGALKPFGRVTKLEVIENRKNTGEKSILATIEPLIHSKDLTNRWSIPLGTLMVRIAPADLETTILKDRNQYTTRLYGIPKATDTVILMRSIKNLNPKTCYIPKCSRTGKERNFAIISFQTKEELDKACISSAKYNNQRLTWSKSRTHHSNIIDNENGKNFWNNKKYIQRSIWEESSDTTSERKWPIKFNTNKKAIQYKDNKQGNHNNIFLHPIISPSISPTASTSTEESPNNPKNQYKGKGKQKEITQEDNTIDKLVAMITQMASRLETIEINMGNIPNRS